MLARSPVVLTGARRHKLRALMFLSLVWIVFAAYAYGGY